MKHKLKLAVRSAYARVLYHTGLHRLVNRIMPPRMTILFGHCIDDEACNGFLPRDMKMSAATLERVVGYFKQRGYEVTGIGDGMDLLDKKSPRSVVALSFDDGYRDNRTRLAPLLEQLGASATIFLESAPLDERNVNWSHKYHWVIRDGDVDGFAREYLTQSSDSESMEKVRRALEDGGEQLAYHVKRVLKYDADVADRDSVIDAIFRARGGDERSLCDALYMDWDDARALHQAGIELGGHTVSHPILSRLDAEEVQREVGECRKSMERELGPGNARVFAYPFGRRWDYNDDSMRAAREAGFELAVNTHAGTNSANSDRFQLRRLPIDDRSAMHLTVAEACGGFDLLRRIGIDLSE